MKRMFYAKAAAVVLACMTLYCPEVSALEAGGVLGDDNTAPVIFINGEMVAGGYDIAAAGVAKAIGYDCVIENGSLYVPPELIQNELNITVDPASTSYPVALHNGSAYVALRPVAEELGMTVNYAPQMTEPYEYYYDTHMPVSPADTIIRGRQNIIIDKAYGGETVISKEEATEKTKALCLEALVNFKKGLLEEAPGLAEDCDGIEKEINRMLYIGEVSRFYKFTIGPYDVLYDKTNGEVFFVIYSSNTLIKEVDINDGGLYSPIFLVG